MFLSHPGPRCLGAAAGFLLCLSSPAVASAATADLSITNVTLQGDRTVGSEATYTYDVFNAGPDAVDATLTAELGAAEDLLSVTPSHGSCNQSAPVTCTLGSVAPGAAMSVTTRVRFARTGDNQHSVRVDGSGGTTDPNENNNLGGQGFQVTEPEPAIVQQPLVRTLGWLRTQATLEVEAELSPFGSGTFYFEYGRTKAYGKRTAARAVSGEDGVERKAMIKGLKLGTTYHYRAVLVVDGKTYRGRNRSARTLGRLLYALIELKATKRSAKSTRYVGSVGDGLATAPGACKGRIRVEVYTLAGADLLAKTTKVRPDCTYSITIPFGSAQARRYGKKGNVLVQARFSGNRAVASAGSASDRP